MDMHRQLRFEVERTAIPGVKRREGTLDVAGFLVPPAWVRVEYGMTLRLGASPMGLDAEASYAKINCSILMPCYKEEIDTVREDLATFLGAQLRREREELESELREAARQKRTT